MAIPFETAVAQDRTSADQKEKECTLESFVVWQTRLCSDLHHFCPSNPSQSSFLNCVSSCYQAIRCLRSKGK